MTLCRVPVGNTEVAEINAEPRPSASEAARAAETGAADSPFA